MCTLVRINECAVWGFFGTYTHVYATAQFHLAIDAILPHSLSAYTLFHVLFCLSAIIFVILSFHFVANGAVAPVVVVELLSLSLLLFVVFGFIYIVSVRLHYYRVFANFHPFKSFCTNCVHVRLFVVFGSIQEQHISDICVFPRSEPDEAHVMHIVIMNIQTHTHMLMHTLVFFFFLCSVIQHWTDLNNIILHCVLRLPIVDVVVILKSNVLYLCEENDSHNEYKQACGSVRERKVYMRRLGGKQKVYRINEVICIFFI